MDKTFGYDNFRNEIVWTYTSASNVKKDFPRKHDVILRYSKGETYTFNKDAIRVPYAAGTLGRFQYAHPFSEGHELNELGKVPEDWSWPFAIVARGNENIGYPTQKPEALLERIIKASSNEGDTVADFFVGGGTTGAVALRNNRRFIGCDISRVAISVSASRLILPKPPPPAAVNR